MMGAPATIKAWAYANGLIVFGKRMPAGTLLIASGPQRKLLAAIDVLARHGQGKSAGRLLVPGVPEAPDQGSGIRALHRFISEIARRVPNVVLPEGLDLAVVRAHMANPFVVYIDRGQAVQYTDAESRIHVVNHFDEFECHAARALPGLQATVRKAIDVRFNKLMNGYGKVTS